MTRLGRGKGRTMMMALAAVLVAALAPAQAVRDVPRVSVEEVKQLIAENKVLLVDTRIEGEFLMGHIPGAIHINSLDADWRAEELKGETRQIITYCA